MGPKRGPNRMLRAVDGGSFTLRPQTATAGLQLLVVFPRSVLNGGLQEPEDLDGEMHGGRALVHDEALEPGAVLRVVDEQVAELGHEGLEVGVGQDVEFITEVVVDAAGLAVAVEVCDGHESVEEVGAEEAQQGVHGERPVGLVMVRVLVEVLHGDDLHGGRGLAVARVAAARFGVIAERRGPPHGATV